MLYVEKSIKCKIPLFQVYTRLNYVEVRNCQNCCLGRLLTVAPSPDPSPRSCLVASPSIRCFALKSRCCFVALVVVASPDSLTPQLVEVVAVAPVVVVVVVEYAVVACCISYCMLLLLLCSSRCCPCCRNIPLCLFFEISRLIR